MGALETLSNASKILVIQTTVLAVLASISYFSAGPLLAIIFILLWLDKAIIPPLLQTGYFGFELTTLAVILVGLTYGPSFGFVFGLLIVPFLVGIFNIIVWRVNNSSEIPAIVPSADNIIDGIIAILASWLSTILPLIGAVIAAILIKSVLVSIRQQITEGYMNYLERMINIGINFFIFWSFQDYILGMISI